MKKIHCISLLVTSIIFVGCFKQHDYVRNIRFFDGNSRGKVIEYRIVDNNMFVGFGKVGEVQDNNDQKEVIINENNEQVNRDSFENKVIKIYTYTEEKDKAPTFSVKIISSENGICKDFNAGLPIKKGSILNIYQPNGYIRFAMQDSFSITKNPADKFSDNYSQLGFEKLSSEETQKVQEVFIEAFRNYLADKCAQK